MSIKKGMHTAAVGWFWAEKVCFSLFLTFLKKSEEVTFFSYIFSKKVTVSQWQRCNWNVTESVTEAKKAVLSYILVTFSYNSVTIQLQVKPFKNNGLTEFVTENRKKVQVTGIFDFLFKTRKEGRNVVC